MATVRVQANCRACRSDVDEFKGPGSMSMMSMITVPLLYLEWPKPCSYKLSKCKGNLWFYETLFSDTYIWIYK